jgi:hypothetical protein
MAFPVKQVRALEEPLCIIEEVEKNPSEKWTDIAKQLGLPSSTLNTIIVKKIREHAYVCGLGARNVCCAVWMEEMCGELGSGSCMEEVMTTMKLDFTEALRAFQSMRVFMYAHNITDNFTDCLLQIA